MFCHGADSISSLVSQRIFSLFFIILTACSSRNWTLALSIAFHKIILAHPLKVKTIASAKIKTNKICRGGRDPLITLGSESGKTTDRPAFRDMVSMARRTTKPFDIILVWKYSRFARNREDSIVFKTMLRKAGVQVISITEPFEDTPTGRLFEAMYD